MKKIVLIIATLFSMVTAAQAYPTLQLDIGGGAYVLGSETTVAKSSSFTLYALLDSKTGGTLLNDTFYLSAAVYPQQKTDADLGTFTFNGGTPISVTADMTYGNPPTALVDTKDLQDHGIFPTYFTEFAFQFDSNSQINPYDVQKNPGGPTSFVGSGMYYKAFDIDVSGLTSITSILHFDLYSLKFKDAKSKGEENLEFAPFSHDAQSGPPVPEPGTIVLLAAGLFGLGIFSRRRMSK